MKKSILVTILAISAFTCSLNAQSTAPAMGGGNPRPGSLGGGTSAMGGGNPRPGSIGNNSVTTVFVLMSMVGIYL